MSFQPSLQLNAQYGNVMVDANRAAYLRGTGNFNPPPNWEQTTDRGVAYSDAANFYIDNADDRPKLPKLPSAPMGDYMDQLDQWNKQPWVVGSSGIHPQKPGSWNTPNIDGVRSRYEEFASKSSHLDPNTLMGFFFSVENVDYLQNRVVDEVKRIKKVDISKQSEDELLIIMNNYYQKALSGWLPHEDSNGKPNPNEVYPRGTTSCSLTSRLSRLNASVLEECVKQILSGIDMYLKYYEDASSLPLPLTRPSFTSMKGSRVLSERVGLYDNPHEATKAVNSFNERGNII
jgi:hypothetical protein